MFSGKTLLITGGTGSFGTAVLNRFLATDIGELRIFSRDKEKQDTMRREFQRNMPEAADKIKLFIGDVRDPVSLKSAMHGVDFVFHGAALKGIPACESSPVDAIEINALGTDNVLTAAVEAGVRAVICLSTDKAVYPASAMGISKAMMEKIVLAKSREISPKRTKFCCTRYGNVLCSKGSVIPLWIEQMKSGKPITITEPNMTRFIMSIDEAIDLVLLAFEHGDSGDIWVQKSPACTIGVQAQAVKELFHCTDEIKVIGAREGEKQYETLLSQDECDRATDMGGFYRISCDNRDLNYNKYFTHSNTNRNLLTEFNSNNTELLNVAQVKEKLLALPYIREEIIIGEIK